MALETRGSWNGLNKQVVHAVHGDCQLEEEKCAVVSSRVSAFRNENDAMRQYTPLERIHLRLTISKNAPWIVPSSPHIAPSRLRATLDSSDGGGFLVWLLL